MGFDATRLVLAFTTSGRPSHGTATTMVENLHRGARIRRNGRIVAAAASPALRAVDFGHGAVPVMRLTDNMLLSRHATDRKTMLGPLGVIATGAVAAATQRVNAAMDVRKSAEDPEAAALSGGNLQKFIIGRELDRAPAVLVVNQPTWGVDAGASARIRQALIDLARTGSAVLVISQDLDELFEICDAIAVMHNGHLSAPVPIGEATFETIGLLMGGAEPGHVAHDGAGMT